MRIVDTKDEIPMMHQQPLQTIQVRRQKFVMTHNMLQGVDIMINLKSVLSPLMYMDYMLTISYFQLPPIGGKL